MAKKVEVKGLFYITHVNNVPSILKHGIYSHAMMEAKQLSFTPIYDSQIVSSRKDKIAPNGGSLWEFANLYFQARNPMMYRVVHEKSRKDLAVVGVIPSILQKPGVFVTDGNAASRPTQFYTANEGLAAISDQWKTIQAEYWNELDGSKRKIMSECLVPGHIPPENIHSIFVATHEVKNEVEKAIWPSRLPVVPEPKIFFHPSYRTKIGTNISLVEGDMFFSDMQTLTVSVNLQGIMGKGLASRTKYQFPDVYVFYQDACRSRRITATKPVIYKREASLDEELADLDAPLATANSVKWFLLFATKRKWRESSRLDDIEGGLNWFRDNFQSEGVRSVAMPALGCGLGNLDWADVGPLMCRYLHGIGIDVAIYLPRERAIDPMFLSERFLLGRSIG